MARRRHNTQTPRDRQRLLDDFQRRLRYDQEQGDLRHWLRRPNSIAWVVHPMADESELLAELGLRSEECRSVNAYWEYRGSVYFVQFRGAERHDTMPGPGIYYRFDRSHRQDCFEVLIPRPRVTSHDLHRALAVLESLVDSGVVDAARAALKESVGRWLRRDERLAPVE